jgi:hypothetical protein
MDPIDYPEADSIRVLIHIISSMTFQASAAVVHLAIDLNQDFLYIGDSQGLAGPWHPILRTRAGFVLLLPSRQLLNLTRTSVAGALAAPVRKPCKRLAFVSFSETGCPSGSGGFMSTVGR